MLDALVPASDHAEAHCCKDLMTLFNQQFALSENTRLVLGGKEPIYLPADQNCHYHRIIFAHGFFSSALHECAHWCIAGKERRLREDYGYWYAADGRDRVQQLAFEQVEIKPQAIEWILSKACKKRFRVSIDNLSGEPTDSNNFKRLVHRQVIVYCEQGLPPRAALLQRCLAAYYGCNQTLDASDYQLVELN